MGNRTFIKPDIAKEIRKAYESPEVPGIAKVAEQFGTVPAVVSVAIQEAGGSIRGPGGWKKAS
ncbi:MAG: hypothetical protein HQM00_05595 [Magnetococcales bacterium]|nr:hypothetical protein [Magnetococcales bacterium]